MTFTPTPEQLAIVSAARDTTDNILVQALAGAAKTSTLELIAKSLAGHKSLAGGGILAVAFNKRISEEMSKRLPSHCVCKTLNSIGHTAWAQFTGKRLTLDKGKMGEIVKNLDLTRREKDALREVFGDVVKLSSRAKLYGYVPENRYDEATHLIDRDTLEEVLSEEEYDRLAWDLLDQILIKSITQAYSGTIDFDDQIYMSSLFGAQLPRFPLVLVDEAQDLSPLNHFMISRLVAKRIIAVGDHYQSIYGFRGAVSDGMDVLRRRFQMKELRLSVSFRCPQAIVRMARSRAPYMQWAENAPEGEVVDLTNLQDDTEDGTPWGPTLFPPACAVICRNNAPLFGLGLRLLRAGRNISIRGFDLSKRLIKILNEFGDHSMPQTELLANLYRWREAAKAEGKLKQETIEDRYACLVIFAEAAPDLGSAIAYAEALFASAGPIELLSGHKSKGLEWTHVFHLDPWRVPSEWARTPEELEQERNIEYVITTRAKQSLTLINLDNYNPEI